MTALFARNPLGAAMATAPFALAGLAVLATSLMMDRGPAHSLASPVIESRLVIFSDAPHGAVRVDAADGGVIASFASGEGAFVRGVLRTFARDRRASAVSPEAPFALARHADGRVTLKDPSNGQTVVLNAFGPTNAAAFASLLSGRRVQP